MKYIVSDEYRFIYFVVQKVACTSIKTALAPLFGIDTTGTEIPREDRAPRFVIHELFDKSGHQINRRQLISGLEGPYKGYFKFAFVRNPWDRLVSCYRDKLVGDGLGLSLPNDVDVRLYRGMRFAEFVEGVHKIPDNKADPHFRSQHRVVCGPGRDRLILTDFVGRFENLQADFQTVAERIGAPELRLPHILRSTGKKSRSYTAYYDGRSKQLVSQRYRKDINTFGYPA